MRVSVFGGSWFSQVPGPASPPSDPPGFGYEMLILRASEEGQVFGVHTKLNINTVTSWVPGTTGLPKEG